MLVVQIRQEFSLCLSPPPSNSLFLCLFLPILERERERERECVSHFPSFYLCICINISPSIYLLIPQYPRSLFSLSLPLSPSPHFIQANYKPTPRKPTLLPLPYQTFQIKKNQYELIKSTTVAQSPKLGYEAAHALLTKQQNSVVDCSYCSYYLTMTLDNNRSQRQ